MSELLAVHVEGPDDIIAVASREEGEKLIEEINKTQRDLIASAPADKRDLYPLVQASVIKWEWEPARHAELLIEQQEDEKRFQQVRTAKQKPEPK